MNLGRRIFLLSSGAVIIGAGATGLSFRNAGTADGYSAAIDSQRARLRQGNHLREMVRFATLAANGHNTQPWRFQLSAREIAVLPDFSRRTPVVDPDDHHLYVSLGCATENIALAAGAFGLRTHANFESGNGGRIVIALESAPETSSVLRDAIPHRQSTRADFRGRTVSAEELSQLDAAGQAEGVRLVMVADAARLGRIRDLVASGNTAQMRDPAFVAELKAWIRFNPAHALETGDGIYSAAGGNPVLPTWLGRPLFDLTFTAEAENRKYASQIDSSAGVAIFFAELDDPEHWVRVGRACQRFALQATALGLKHSFINQPVEVQALRAELAALAGVPTHRPDIVMRFGHGPDLPKSPRRPADQVMI